jgi:PIN domain nuclease of toxin-antitoxin system
MKLLLDTHVLLWALGRPDRLSTRSRDLIEDPANELLVSAASAFELSTKHRLGKLPQAGALLLAYPETLAQLGANELAMLGRHAIVAGRLEWEHRDPFDRMLAAQSILEGVPLVSSDSEFRALSGVHVIWE